jgi:hypothetical protein
MRWSLFVAAVMTAFLVVAGSAGAVPRLVVFQSSYLPAASTSVDAALLQGKQDRPVGKVVLTLQGGNIDFSKPVGTTLGNAAAVATTAADSVFKGASVTFSGPVVVADPEAHLVDGTACTGSATHDGVWQLQLASQGQSLPLMLFVDRNTQSLQGRYIVTLCAASPFVAPDQGGAPFGAALSQLFLHLNVGLYRNSGGAGVYHWWGFVTPYLDGGSTLDANAGAETRALTPIPAALALWREHARRDTVRFAGVISLYDFGLAGARLDVYAGTNKNKLRLVGHTSKVTKKGSYTYTRSSPARATFFQVTVGPLDVTNVPGDLFCGGGSEAALGCVSATLSELDSNVLRVAGKR